MLLYLATDLIINERSKLLKLALKELRSLLKNDTLVSAEIYNASSAAAFIRLKMVTTTDEEGESNFFDFKRYLTM